MEIAKIADIDSAVPGGTFLLAPFSRHLLRCVPGYYHSRLRRFDGRGGRSSSLFKLHPSVERYAGNLVCPKMESSLHMSVANRNTRISLATGRCSRLDLYKT